MNRARIINEIIENTPEEIKQLEDTEGLMRKARYLYLELCKRCHYNPKYNKSSIEEQDRMFNERDNETDNEFGLCNDFTMTGVDLFKKMGFKNIVAIDVNGNVYKEERRIFRKCQGILGISERKAAMKMMLYEIYPNEMREKCIESPVIEQDENGNFYIVLRITLGGESREYRLESIGHSEGRDVRLTHIIEDALPVKTATSKQGESGYEIE